ncbi:hypothetical protein LMG18101_03809 [Ralstonia flaminis]|jgi:hypothetical protein|uniref:Uncharacterized protein n=2 Tax=Ralstonia flaminis TaxID=3058597 RepID=A0ABN9JST6_9RALS|nr:hypothetical protein LMG18101_03809 [Ralstonia sp. LMG 18101]
MPDFMESRFDGAEETLDFSHGMLTKAGYAQLPAELRRLRAKPATLHDEAADAPLAEKRGTALLLAMRLWEPDVFRPLRRVA